MAILHRLLFSLIIFAGLSTSVLGFDGLPDAKPESVGLSSDKLKEIDAWLERTVADGKLAGLSVAIMRRGKVAYVGKAGFADKEAGRPIQDDTVFWIASMTKPVTSVAIMRYYEQDKFGLDDPLSNFFPQFKDMQVFAGMGENDTPAVEPARRPITIRQLLTHTAGFAGRGELPADKYLFASGMVTDDQTRAEFLDKLARLPLAFHPGEEWHYSPSVEVLAGLVEKFSGQTLDVLYEKTLFKPLGMNNTTFFPDEAMQARIAQRYKYDPESQTLKREPLTRTETAYSRDPKIIWGAGGLYSTLGDYLRFCQMLLNDGKFNGAQILESSTVALMMQDHIPPTTGPKPGGIDGYGFGLGGAVLRNVEESKFPGSVGEFNWAGLAGTLFWIDKKEDLVVVLMTQYVPPPKEISLRKQLKPLVYAAIVK
jgi:CubicO group peptidase (beta-lactamase class C family)